MEADTDGADGRYSLALDLLRAGVTDGAMPGGVVCVYLGGERVLHAAFGAIDGQTPAVVETLYDLASLTKPLATAAVTISCLEDGALLLDDRLGDLLPDTPDHLARISIRHLLTHTSGLPAWAPCYNDGAIRLDAAVNAIFALPASDRTPGDHYAYSCLGFLLLTAVLREVTGTPLDTAARARIFEPLGLSSLTFTPAGATQNQGSIAQKRSGTCFATWTSPLRSESSAFGDPAPSPISGGNGGRGDVDAAYPRFADSPSPPFPPEMGERGLGGEGARSPRSASPNSESHPTPTTTPEPGTLTIAPTLSHEGPAHDDPLVGLPHDGNARAITLGGDVPGNAGLFGTATDVAAFGEALRTGRLFGAPATVRSLTSQIPPEVGGHTLMFYAQPNPLNPIGDLLSPRAVGHSGFTGTALVIDPEYDLTVAVITNCVLLPGAKPKWLRVRRRLMNAIAGTLRR